MNVEKIKHLFFALFLKILHLWAFQILWRSSYEQKKKKRKERKIEKKRENITSPRYTALIVAWTSINNDGNVLYLKRESGISITTGKSKLNIKPSTCMREFQPQVTKTKSQCHGKRRLVHNFGARTCTFIASCHFPLLILENKLKFNNATLTYIAELIPPYFSNSKKMKLVIVLYDCWIYL